MTINQSLARTALILLLAAACCNPIEARAQSGASGGVDGSIEDQYPNLVAMPVRVVPGKGELPAQLLVSGPSPFVANCDGQQTGFSFVNSEVEPHIAVNPLNHEHMIGAWQQDRWSNGGARGLVASISLDGGLSWVRRALPFSRCGGGNASNGGNYLRATDPWVAFSPNGTAYVMALAFSGVSFQSGSVNAMLVSRSLDGGSTWSNPTPLIVDGPNFFNDKNTITADPTDANYVYATWDRLGINGGGPAYFARSINGGASWQAARAIHNPGINSQTIGNVIAVHPDGTLLNLFTQIDEDAAGQLTAVLAVIRSTDKGSTWSAPIQVAELLAIGTYDPENSTTIRDGSILGQIAIGPSGNVHVVWQDARFSGGFRDGIAMASSSDAGLTWSQPARVNGDLNVQAFMPSVHVSANGTIGVTYYDLRSNTDDPADLRTDYWLARSTDGVGFRESRVSPPFDLSTAPNAGGLFVGDYQGLVSKGAILVPFFVRTNAGASSNRTDVYVAPANFIVSNVVPGTQIAIAAENLPGFRKKVHDNIFRQRRPVGRRKPGEHRLPEEKPTDP